MCRSIHRIIAPGRPIARMTLPSPSSCTCDFRSAPLRQNTLRFAKLILVHDVKLSKSICDRAGTHALSQKGILNPTRQRLAKRNTETDRAGRPNASIRFVIYLYAGPLPLKSIVSSLTASFLASSHAYHLSVKACLIACCVLRTCEWCTISNL